MGNSPFRFVQVRSRVDDKMIYVNPVQISVICFSAEHGSVVLQYLTGFAIPVHGSMDEVIAAFNLLIN